MEGQLDVYVNDVLLIERGIRGIETKSSIAPGIFAYSGKAEFADFNVYELES